MESYIFCIFSIIADSENFNIGLYARQLKNITKLAKNM